MHSRGILIKQPRLDKFSYLQKKIKGDFHHFIEEYRENCRSPPVSPILYRSQKSQLKDGLLCRFFLLTALILSESEKEKRDETVMESLRGERAVMKMVK